MDLPPPAQEPEPDAARAGELEWRLSQLEAGLRHIDRRLDRLQETLVSTVVEHTEAVGRDLRHTVSELGRRLALDLPQVLARHRDEIVAELRATPAEPEPEAEPEPRPASGPAEAVGPDPVEAVGPDPVEAPAEGSVAPEAVAKRRRRMHVLRQRDA